MNKKSNTFAAGTVTIMAAVLLAGPAASRDRVRSQTTLMQQDSSAESEPPMPVSIDLANGIDPMGGPAPGGSSATPVGRVVGIGQASWYGPGFQGRRTASGEAFNQNAFTAAHRSLPFGSRIQVTNQKTGQTIVVRINDRGPHARGRIIDLSRASARALGIGGAAPVRLVSLQN